MSTSKLSTGNENKIGKIVFPNEWSIYKLNELLKLVKRPIKMEDDHVYNLVTVKRRFGGMVERGRLCGNQIEVKSQFSIKLGDFVISKRQISHGACAIVPESLDGSIVSNEYNVLRNKERLDLDFFNWYVQLPYMQRYFYLSSDGVHIEKLLFKLEDWFKRKVCIPEANEQKKIAKIILTWDKAIELKEKLIGQKKEQKKGLMQKLLTGEIRLTGFEGAWETAQLGKIGKTYNGLSGKSAEDFGEGKPYIPYKTIFDDSKIDITKLEYVRVDNNEKQNIAKYGDIFFTTSSETPDEVGMSSVLLDQVDELYLNSFCFGYRLNNFNVLLPEFAQFLFRGNEFRSKIFSLAQGSTRFNISKNEVMKIEVCLPSVEEQKSIASVLSDSDREIKLLQYHVEFIKEQKKGLMQLLLTGKIRVKV